MKTIRKFTVATAGVAADCLAAGVLHGGAQTAAMLFLSAVAALGVYAVPNAPARPRPTSVL